jgi:hypothetical protein
MLRILPFYINGFLFTHSNLHATLPQDKNGGTYMNATCILIYGSEERFQNEIESFKSYLCGNGHLATVMSYDDPEIRQKIKNGITGASANSPLLLAFSGHGSPTGWEGSAQRYRTIASYLKGFRGPAIIVNDTCHGQEFQKHLRHVRSPEDTYFISPPRAYNTTRGGAISETMRCWKSAVAAYGKPGTLRIETVEYLRPGKPSRTQKVHQIWGTPCDNHFYPR